MWRYGCLACLLLAAPAFGQDAPRLDDFGDPLPPGALRRFGTTRFRQDYVNEIAFLPDGKSLVAQGERRIVHWDVATGKPLRTIVTDNCGNRSLGLGAGGRLLVVNERKETSVVIDLIDGKEKFRTKIEEGQSCGAVSPDGSVLAIGFDKGLKLFDLKSGKELPCAMQDCIEALRFSPDGKTLVTQGRLVNLIDLGTGESRVQMTVEWTSLQDCARALEFTADGRSLIVGTGLSGVRTFDVVTGKRLGRLDFGSKLLAVSPGRAKCRQDKTATARWCFMTSRQARNCVAGEPRSLAPRCRGVLARRKDARGSVRGGHPTLGSCDRQTDRSVSRADSHSRAPVRLG